MNAAATPCTCRADMEAELLRLHQADTPQATQHKVDIQGYGLGLVGNRLIERGYFTVLLQAEATTKSGTKRIVKKRQNLMFTFCPFCARKYQTEEAAS